jgi:hypothetical protein
MIAAPKRRSAGRRRPTEANEAKIDGPVNRHPSKDRPGRLRRSLTAVGIALLVLVGVIATAVLLSPDDEGLPFDYEGFD